jgi:hypothetical protein
MVQITAPRLNLNTGNLVVAGVGSNSLNMNYKHNVGQLWRLASDSATR